VTPDSTIPEGLAAVAESVTRALATTAVSTSPAIAFQASDLMIRLAFSFTLHNLGRSVARRELAAITHDLEVGAQRLVALH
jgi:hypothetical protein